MKLKYIVMSTALGLVALSSCSDFLDKDPDNRVKPQTLKQLRELMVDGYSSTSYACVGELSSDNVIDNNTPSDNGLRYNRASYSAADDQLYRWEHVTMGQDNDTPTGTWEGNYGAIAVCNAVLEKVAEIEETGETYDGPLTSEGREQLAAIKGEALVSRAWHHFILVNTFCMPYGGPEKSKGIQGVPYMTAPETTVKPHYDRGTLAHDYEMIEKDLMEGLPLINDGFYEVPKYHFNKASANAFAARFFLYKREYEKVVEYATAAFKGNDPATMANTLWSNSDFYYIKDIGRYNTSIERPNVWMCFTTYTTFWRRFVSSGRYACNRAAKRCTIQGPGPSWENCKYQNSRTKESFAMMPCFNGYCGTAGGTEYGVYFAGNSFEQFEYTDKIAGIGYCHGIRAEFTSQQTLLDRAEAYFFLGEKELAMADLQQWNEEHRVNTSGDERMTALTEEQIVKFYTKCLNKYVANVDRTDLKEKYSDSIWFGIAKPINLDKVNPNAKYQITDELMPYIQCVQHFRRIETVHTGQRWFDIKRLGLEVIHKQAKSGSEANVYTLRYSDDEMRYAIEVPYSAILAGLDPNSKPKTTALSAAVESKGNYVKVN